MFNMNNRKTRRRIAGAIVILLVLAMVIPTLSYFLY